MCACTPVHYSPGCCLSSHEKLNFLFGEMKEQSLSVPPRSACCHRENAAASAAIGWRPRVLIVVAALLLSHTSTAVMREGRLGEEEAMGDGGGGVFSPPVGKLLSLMFNKPLDTEGKPDLVHRGSCVCVSECVCVCVRSLHLLCEYPSMCLFIPWSVCESGPILLSSTLYLKGGSDHVSA